MVPGSHYPWISIALRKCITGQNGTNAPAKVCRRDGPDEFWEPHKENLGKVSIKIAYLPWEKLLRCMGDELGESGRSHGRSEYYIGNKQCELYIKENGRLKKNPDLDEAQRKQDYLEAKRVAFNKNEENENREEAINIMLDIEINITIDKKQAGRK